MNTDFLLDTRLRYLTTTSII